MAERSAIPSAHTRYSITAGPQSVTVLDHYRYRLSDSTRPRIQSNPACPIIGEPEAFRDGPTPLPALATNVAWLILTLAAQDDTGMNERVDTFQCDPSTFPDGDVSAWPIAAVWRIACERVVLWPDCYDLDEPKKQLGVSLADFGATIVRANTPAPPTGFSPRP